MNKHQEFHHGLDYQDHPESHAHVEINDPATCEAGDRDAVLDELEKMMFERAR